MKSVIACIALCATLPTNASAQDPTTTGAVQFLASPPAAAYRHYAPLESAQTISLFRERGPFVLTHAVDLDHTGTSQTFNGLLIEGTLPVGTRVESYFFDQDSPPNLNTSNPNDQLTVKLDGSATFTKPIFGVIIKKNSLKDSDSKLGWPATIYPGEVGDPNINNLPQDSRGLELDADDEWIKISPDRMTINVKFFTRADMDHVRVVIAADAPGRAFCFGDQSSGQSCPCQNDVPAGVKTGCANSTGVGALLSYDAGSNSTAVNNFSLKMSNLTPHTFGLLYMGQNTTQQPFADGFRCVSPGPPGSPPGSGFLRFPFKNASAQGEIIQQNIVGYMNGGATAVIQAGSTWHFQGYYRNPAMQCTNANLTNGLSVTFF
jgi:hypothetical protein